MTNGNIYNMVKKILSFLTLLTAFALNSSAQIRFAYDLDFDFRFDNREYDRSGFQNSQTLFGARLPRASSASRVSSTLAPH